MQNVQNIRFHDALYLVPRFGTKSGTKSGTKVGTRLFLQNNFLKNFLFKIMH